MEKSILQKARMAYEPKLPVALQGAVKVKEGAPTQSVDNQEEIKKLFPNTYGMPIVEFEPSETANNNKMNVGIILSGGQAPGGHNVITGLFDQIKKLNPENRLYGFILGPGGLVDHNYMELTKELVDNLNEYLTLLDGLNINELYLQDMIGLNNKEIQRERSIYVPGNLLILAP